MGAPALLGDRRRAPEFEGCPVMPTGPTLSPTGRRLRAKYAILTRHRPDAPETAEAARDYRAERLAAAIRREVDASPPLTAEQIEKLRGLLPAPCAQSGDRQASTA